MRLTGKYRMENGTLRPFTLAGVKQYEKFISSLKEGSVVEFFYEMQTDDGSLAQLAKIHAAIRDLCNHTGYTFEDMKLLVKKRAGLCIEKELDGSKFLYCKSFGDCSKQELSLAIEALQEISQFLEFPLL